MPVKGLTFVSTVQATGAGGPVTHELTVKGGD